MISHFVKFIAILALMGACNWVNAKPGCTAIAAAPFIINESGCFTLSNDIYVKDISMNAITVNANNVTVDLRGHKIQGANRQDAMNSGIYGNNIKSLRVTNGLISGFLYGIRIDGEGFSDIIKIDLLEMRDNGFRGVGIMASNASVINNKIFNTGGTKIFNDSFAMGIEIIGRDAIVRSNLVDGVNPVGVGEGVGISLSRNRENALIERNIIRGGGGIGSTFGIWLSNKKENTRVLNNVISGFNVPFNVPRVGGGWIPKWKILSPTIELYGNKSLLTACNMTNYKSFYQGVPRSNIIEDRVGAPCPLLISVLTRQYVAKPTDSRVVFRLAQTMQWCSDDPIPPEHICYHLKRSAISFYKDAELLGVKEASRMLPKVKKEVQENYLSNTNQ